VDVETMWARVVVAPVGRLGTVTAEGRPHLVPCCYAVDVERQMVFSAVDGKPKSTQQLKRLANIRAHPVATLLVDHYEADWSQLWWVRLDGAARIVDDGSTERDHALALLVAKYEQYREARPTGPVLALDITAWQSWP
jgi:PPOX class probable F420-dependent enzyme